MTPAQKTDTNVAVLSQPQRGYQARARVIAALRQLSRDCGDEIVLLDTRADLERALLRLVQENREQRAHLGPWIAGPK